MYHKNFIEEVYPLENSKKQSNLARLMTYAGWHRYLTYSSLLLSVVSAVLGLFPFVFIIQEVIAVAPNYAQAGHLVQNGWLAVLFAVLSILVYVAALMCSHLSAFRIAGNIRKALMAHISKWPVLKWRRICRAIWTLWRI